MRNVLIVVMLMGMLIAPSYAAWYDIGRILDGRMMNPTGAPWFGDNQVMYFGTDKDASIKFNSTSGYAEVVGLAIFSNQSVAMESGEDITFAGGDSKLDIDQGTGITSTTTGTNYLNGNVQIPSGKTFKSGGTATLNALAVNTTGAFTGLLSANGGLATGVNASTVLSTTLTASSVKTVYDIDASGANRTLTLPDAATVGGRMYFISVSGNPGSNYVRITATGGDDINANNYLVSTDQWSTALVVASNGAYRALTSGTWAAHA